MTSSRKYIISLIEQGVIPEENVQESLNVLEVRPPPHSWRTFLDHLFLWVAGCALGLSVIFFVAYNWEAVDRLVKFGLIQVLILGAIITYCKFSEHKIIGKVSLLVATLFLGALMALYGQTYQTGADPWQLFFNWSLLMLPWALIGRFPALWIIWVGLINLSIVLYYQTFRGVFGFLFSSEESLWWIIFIFNACVLFTWEVLCKKWLWMNERWAIRLLGFGCGVAITGLGLFTIFDGDTGSFGGLAWLVWSLLLYWVYRRLKPDLFMLAGGCLSGIVVIVALLSKHLLKDFNAGIFLLLAFIVIGLGTSAAVWLRTIHKELQS